MTAPPQMTARKAEIVRVAGQMMAERGFEGASLRHIADAFGMRRGSLYAHFDSKEEIVGLVLGPALNSLRATLEVEREPTVTAAAHLADRLAAAVRCTIEHRDAFLILFQDRRLLETSEGLRPLSEEAIAMTPLWIELIEAARVEGSISPDLEATTVAFGLYALLVAGFSDRHLGLEAAGASMDPEAIVAKVVRLFFSGVAGAPLPPGG